MNSASELEPFKEFVPSLCEVCLCPVVANARVLVYEAARAKKLAERAPKSNSANHAGLEVESTARGAYLSSEASW
jgi:hypothetical protein